MLPPAPALRDLSRLQPLAAGLAAGGRDVAVLALVGAGAAAVQVSVDLRLGIPGHHILLAMFPLALGLALVPRRAAGTVMGAVSVLTLTLLGAAGARLPGPGALTGLVLAGPLLDVTLRRGGSGWRLYGAFVAAGAVANVAAFFVRGATKYSGWGGMGGGRALAAWLPVAVWTYAAAGILAGLLSAAVWFHFRVRR